MSRSTAAALIAAGVVGIAGGTVCAVVRGDGASGAASASRSPTTTPSPSVRVPAPATSAGPSSALPGSGSILYAGNRTIHDGKSTIRYDAPFGTPHRLVRSADGYLIEQATSAQLPNFRIYHVTPDGSTNRVADLAERWDLDATGTKVVGTDLDTGRPTVWDLTGRVAARGRSFAHPVTAVWQGDRVLVSEEDEPQGAPPGNDREPWRLFTWDPSTGTTRNTGSPGMRGLTATVDGSLLSGSVNVDGVATWDTYACLRVATAPGAPGAPSAPATDWTTCDWRAAGGVSQVFSPDGSRILAVQSQDDGFGPAEFASFATDKGPSAGVKAFLTPDWTQGATWLDGDHLLLVGRTDGDLTPRTGSWIRTCDLSGDCRIVARRDHGRLVIGEQA